MGRVKPTQSENQVADLGSDPDLWAYMASVNADSSSWLYDPLFPLDSESLQQMQQQRTLLYNNNYSWYDFENLKAMQELPLQPTSVWGESDVASPNSQNYVLSDSRDSSPCVSTNAPSESGAQRLIMGENFSGFRDEFRTLPLLEQHKILASKSDDVDLPRRVELHEIFMDKVSRIKARVFNHPDAGETSKDATQTESPKTRSVQPDRKQSDTSSEKEEEREQEADTSKKISRKGVLPSDEMLFSCTRCGVGCRDKTSLRKHMYVHQPRRYFCEFSGCNIGFHTKRDLRRHTDTKHRKLATGVVGSRVRRKSFICKIPACERGKAKPFSRRDNARQHVVGVHGIKNARGEAEKVIEEIDIEIEGDGATEPVEESKVSSTTQEAASKKPAEASSKSAIITDGAPLPSHKASRPKESEDVLAEFTNLQEIRHDPSVTKPKGQNAQIPPNKTSASEPRDNKPLTDSGSSSVPADNNEQCKLIQQQQQQQQLMMTSLLALGQPDTPQADLDRAMDIWEQMAKAEANGTAPPIDPASLFDMDLSMLAGFAKMAI